MTPSLTTTLQATPPLRLTLQQPVSSLQQLIQLASDKTLTSKERALAQGAIRQLPLPQAITFVYFYIITPAFDEEREGIEDLFERADDLYNAEGDPRAFLEEEAREKVKEAINKEAKRLELWQEQLEGSVALHREEMRQFFSKMNEGADKASKAAQTTRAKVLALADRLDLKKTASPAIAAAAAGAATPTAAAAAAPELPGDRQMDRVHTTAARFMRIIEEVQAEAEALVTVDRSRVQRLQQPVEIQRKVNQELLQELIQTEQTLKRLLP